MGVFNLFLDGGRCPNSLSPFVSKENYSLVLTIMATNFGKIILVPPKRIEKKIQIQVHSHNLNFILNSELPRAKMLKNIIKLKILVNHRKGSD